MSNVKKISGDRNTQGQPYDTTLKGWLRENPQDILPQLLPGAIFQEVVDIEAIKPTMRVDRVFKVLYNRALHIFHLELESGSDTNMPARLYAYNAIFYLEYGLPVISMVIYPFRTAMAKSPLVIKSGEEELTTFHFKTLPLFIQEAEHYVREHLTCMYPLLPAMQGANADLITQVMEELASLYREDEVSLAQQFVWMELLLERTDTITSLEKVKIREKLKMYDPLWEEHPKVKKIKAEAEAVKAEKEAEVEAAKAEAQAAKAEAQAAKEAELTTLRKAIVNLVQVRFPNLTEQSQKKVEQLNSLDMLNYLLMEVAGAANETVARHILWPAVA